jgi:hypothetical protein
MILPLNLGESAILSVTDNSQDGAGDEISMRFRFPTRWSILLTREELTPRINQAA